MTINSQYKQRKKIKKKLNPNIIPKYRSFTVRDIAFYCENDESTIHRWIREEGLITIDNQSPAMVNWQTARQFLEYKRDNLKMKTGNAGDLPCLSCKLRKRAFKEQVILTKHNEKNWSVKGICPDCGCKMNMRTTACMFLIKVTWGYELVNTLPLLSINRSSVSNVNTTGKNRHIRKPFQPDTSIKLNAQNERIKHAYFNRKSLRKDNKTIKKMACALDIFDSYFNHQNYKTFSVKRVLGFQKYILERYASCLDTANRTMTYVREFFFWLREQNGYKKIKFNDVDDLFQLSLKDQQRAKKSKPKNVLDFSIWENILLNTPTENLIEHRIQAVIACFLLTGIRIQTLCSLQIGDFYNLNSDESFLCQDGEHIDSKRGKLGDITFYNLPHFIKDILLNWIYMLKKEYNFTDDDPIFPCIESKTDDSLNFIRTGYINKPLKSTTTIRKDLTAFLNKANIDGITPHSIRSSITSLFMGFELTPEQFKAVSQNMTHEEVTTTFQNYGRVPDHRQKTIIRNLDITKLRKQKELRENPKYQYILSMLENDAMLNKVFDFITNNN